MTNQNTQRNKFWLLKIENLSLVRECRKCIVEEFGVQLHLDADNLLETIDRYASKSVDPSLRRLSRPITHWLRACRVEDNEAAAYANIPTSFQQKLAPVGWRRPNR